MPVSPVMISLLRHPHIKAAVHIDRQGKVLQQRGDAKSLIPGPDDSTVVTSLDSNSEKADESLYVCSFDDNDFLVVIFEEDAEFESLKEDVDAMLNN